MTVELTLQAMFDRYPMLFKERSDCYNQLFCVLGNGYEWYNGELVSLDKDYDEATLRAYLVDGKAFQHNKLSIRGVFQYYYEHSSRASEGSGKEVNFDQFPDDVFYTKPRRERWYFYYPDDTIHYLKEYVPLFNIPEDVKPDWAAAIEECKQMLREDGFEV